MYVCVCIYTHIYIYPSMNMCICMCYTGFSGGSVVKNLPANAGDTGSIPGSGRSPEGGSGNPLQYYCLENPWTEEPSRLQTMGSQRVGHN